ncbi:restriction endonuclease [Lentzea sp. NPDC102401]|uniref:restriction endonuclease n=1 Tax=Lentzea sp. NPDC102401 TaxID=3364128 RepID=UPI0038106E92
METESELEKWITQRVMAESSLLSDLRFPSDEMLELYLTTVGDRDEPEVRRLVIAMLFQPRATYSDRQMHEIYRGKIEAHGSTEGTRSHLKALEESPHFQRFLAYYEKEGPEPREGIKWIGQLLPNHPRQAIQALNAYFDANLRHISNDEIHGLSDIEAIIRAKYIGIPEAVNDRRKTFFDISPRQFERLIEELYRDLGYQTSLTRASRDGGRDIEAKREEMGRREYLRIECKRKSGNVGVRDVRNLRSVVETSSGASSPIFNGPVNKGVVVSASGFTNSARQEFATDARMELVTGNELVVLLNEHMGWTWPARVHAITAERP